MHVLRLRAGCRCSDRCTSCAHGKSLRCGICHTGRLTHPRTACPAGQTGRETLLFHVWSSDAAPLPQTPSGRGTALAGSRSTRSGSDFEVFYVWAYENGYAENVKV